MDVSVGRGAFYSTDHNCVCTKLLLGGNTIMVYLKRGVTG